MTPAAIAQSYKDYLSACHILWNISNARFLENRPGMRAELAPMKRVLDYLAAQRLAAWKALVALPIEQFTHGMDNSRSVKLPSTLIFHHSLIRA